MKWFTAKCFRSVCHSLRKTRLALVQREQFLDHHEHQRRAEQVEDEPVQPDVRRVVGKRTDRHARAAQRGGGQHQREGHQVEVARAPQHQIAQRDATGDQQRAPAAAGAARPPNTCGAGRAWSGTAGKWNASTASRLSTPSDSAITPLTLPSPGLSSPSRLSRARGFGHRLVHGVLDDIARELALRKWPHDRFPVDAFLAMSHGSQSVAAGSFKLAPRQPHLSPISPFSDCRAPMSSLIEQAQSRLLTPGGLATGDLDRVFSQLMAPSIDAADLYFQHSRSESWMLEEGIVKDGSHSIEQGVGVRAISRREDRLRLFRRDRAAAAAGGLAGPRAPSPRTAAAPARPLALGNARAAVSGDRSGRQPAQPGQDRAAARGGCLRALARPARHPGDGEPGGDHRHGADRRLRRHPGRRRAPAGAPQRAGDRRAERPARAGLCRRRRALRLPRADRERPRAGVRRRGGAPGAGQPRSGRRARPGR